VGKTGSEPELIAGGGGLFDVAVDGRLIFSKHDAGRFPENQEVLEKLA
jgi:selenoprotein W-related protein